MVAVVRWLLRVQGMLGKIWDKSGTNSIMRAPPPPKYCNSYRHTITASSCDRHMEAFVLNFPFPLPPCKQSFDETVMVGGLLTETFMTVPAMNSTSTRCRHSTILY